MLKTKAFLTAATLISLFLSSAAQAWWSEDWAFRKQIRLDLSGTGAGLTTTMTDTPVLLRLSAGNFSYFGDTLPDGADLRFVAGDDVTPLSFHVERYDSLNQIALVWVRVPQLTGGTNADTIFMYYGNPEAVSASDPGAVFDAEQVLVLPFSTDSPPVDLTSYGNDPTAFSAEPNPAGLIGAGATFESASSLVVPSSPSLRVLPQDGFTLSVWLRPSAEQAGESAVASMRTDDGDAFFLGLQDGVPSARLQLAGTSYEIAASRALVLDNWSHLALRGEPDTLTLYVDGSVAGAIEAPLRQIVGDLVLGATGEYPQSFAGDMDQVRFATTARADDRLRLEARSEAAFSTVVVYGEDAQQEGGHENYFVTTLRNVTVDGWVVIAFLAVMAFISWLVMIFKGMLLSRVSRQNERFMRAYRKLTGDPLALDVADVPSGKSSTDVASLTGVAIFRPSTIFPIYHAGAQEIRKRMQSPAVGAQRAGFSSETINAIRASIDAVLVRERQKLNAQMVLLTIAISGGPFLGLLGTVVGVMITFAAIAASGDVNVNAIAPGIAAALVATVAGLAVAIPALFAYNWLGTRIRDIDANNQVFADEFVGRVAEHYC